MGLLGIRYPIRIESPKTHSHVRALPRSLSVSKHSPNFTVSLSHLKSHGDTCTILQVSPKKRARNSKAPPATAAGGRWTSFRDGGSEINYAVAGSGEVGLQRAEEGNPVGAVAPQSGRRCLRGTQRGPRRTSHRLGRSLRLARRRSPGRSQ